MTPRERDLAVLAACEAKHGGLLTASNLVKDARDKSHPWHSRFDWHDQTAANKWRIEQARELIRSVQFQIVSNETIIRSVAYIRSPDAERGSQGYMRVERLRDDKERARDALLAEFERVGSALKRAHEIAGALDLIAEIDRMIVTVEGLADRVVGRSPPARRNIAQR